MISGLRINLLKSNLHGVGVSGDEVATLAPFIGCHPNSFLFLYLGISVGESMVRVKGWQSIVDHFKKMLSSWKMKLLSIGRRLTLTKSVLGSLGIYLFSIFRIPAIVCHILETLRSLFLGF